MSTQQSSKPRKEKRTSIFSGKLRTITIIFGFIFFAVCAFFWLRGIDNDQINKSMGALFTILAVVCAFLSIPLLNRSDDGQEPGSFQIPSIQINNNNNIYQIQSNAERPSLLPTQTSVNTNSKEQVGTSQSNTRNQQQSPLGDTSNVNHQLTSVPASTLSNQIIAYPSPNGKRNVLDSTLFDKLVRALEGIPATSSFQGRSALLIGLPRNIVSSLHRDNNSDANDLENILTQLDGLGPLETSEQPLIIFIQNALRRAEGLASSKSLSMILEELKHRYELS